MPNKRIRGIYTKERTVIRWFFGETARSSKILWVWKTEKCCWTAITHDPIGVFCRITKLRTQNENCGETSKINPEQLLMTTYWLSNSANKPLISTPNTLNRPKAFLMSGTLADRRKMTGLVRNTHYRNFFESLVQKMNRGHLRRLIKRVAAPKDPTILQKRAI